MSCSTSDKLESSRRDLLDLTTRSRLLHQPRGRTKIVEVVDEFAVQTFEGLVSSGLSYWFLPAPEEGEEGGVPSLLAVPEEPVDEDGIAARHKDRRLQTGMSDEKLQKRLRSIDYEARSYEEEQGVNILYLAIGFLEWYEADASDKTRLAPLILVPVSISRQTAQQQFHIEYSGEDLETNLSLQEKLRVDFGLELPDLKNFLERDGDPVSPYLDAVATAIEGRRRWRVRRDDIVLGFFSFAKFMMYRDLDPKVWPSRARLEQHELVDQLLCSGFGLLGEGGPEAEDDSPPTDPMLLVMDADSSQSEAISVVRDGHSIVIQGPPGTGKSQTITNLIADAVARGQSVLFVAEKMAALNVVHRRLEALGLGGICLELHSHKARKKTVLEELDRTWQLGAPQLSRDPKALARDLEARRARLDQHRKEMHDPVARTGWTPFRIIGELVRIRAEHPDLLRLGFEAAASWDAARYEKGCTFAAGLDRLLEEMEPPPDHPWRGVGLAAVLPDEEKEIATEAQAVLARVEVLEARYRSIREAIGVEAGSFDQAPAVATFLRVLASAPPSLPHTLGHDAWQEDRSSLRGLIAEGAAAQRARASVSEVLIDAVWQRDLTPHRQQLRLRGSHPFRWFFSGYRAAMAEVKGLAHGKLKMRPPEVVALIDSVEDTRTREAKMAERDEFARAVFGRLWSGRTSDFEALAAVLDWVDQAEASDVAQWHHALVCRAAMESPGDVASRLETECQAAVDAVEELLARLDFDRAEFEEPVSRLDLGLLVERLRAWVNGPAGLNRWIQYRRLRSQSVEAGLGEVVQAADDSRVRDGEVLAAFQKAFLEDLLRHVWEERPNLASFRGADHEAVLEEFRDLDRESIRLGRELVAARHHAGMPSRSGHGPIRTLGRQLQLKRRHMPLRRLLREAGEAVQALKPVFMMSPLSVAQYLEPGRLDFDLVVMDEASQIRPVEAIGAIARGRQVVVVGDEKQLPPTRFFDKVGAGEEDEEDDELVLGNVESVLGLGLAQGLGSKMLRWHYRSEHESLIAVSNAEFYDNRLFIIPSDGSSPDAGLFFEKVNGYWDRGRSATNRIEARRVAEAVMAHARTSPGSSLGVGAFSVAQRDAILDELELLRRSHPETEGFFGHDGEEPFFVKNLESLQGDEREVIFISVGYAPDADGYMTMNFGPLQTDGGERRLNVLISRARRRLVVYSSVSAGDIDLERARSRGARVLKTFLRYAEFGELEGYTRPGEREPDSPFETDVGRALEENGYRVHYQVGAAGFFIDVAVVNSDRPGEYLLGIECDGATYHGTKSARDRDRLRQQVLEARGWTIHRIWSTDWFQDRNSQLRKLVAAVQTAEASAIVDGDDLPSEEPPTAARPTEPAIVRAEPELILEDEDSAEAPAYVEASFDAGYQNEPHEVRASTMANVVLEILKVEAPIHDDELGRRVATVWGKERAGRRIQEAATNGARYLVRQGIAVRDGDFWMLVDRDPPTPRSRRHVGSGTLRKAAMIPPSEIRVAILDLLRDNFSIELEELLIALSRLFGFDRLGGELRQAFEDVLRSLLGEEVVELHEGRLTGASTTVSARSPRRPGIP